MKTAPLLAVAAGICGACFLPLPDARRAAVESAVHNKAVQAATPAERRKAGASSEPEEEAPTPDPAAVARMGRAERIAALDLLMKEYYPDSTRMSAAVNLAASLFREPAGGDFPGARQLPGWLLSPVCQVVMTDPGGVPAALSRCLPAQRHGMMAASAGARVLGKTGDAKTASLFLRSMPPEWRKNLAGSLKHGLASVRPRAALAGVLPESDQLSRVMETAAREGPCGDALEVLLERRADLSDGDLRWSLRSLLTRDPEETARQVAAQNDESLTKLLAEVRKESETAAAAAPPPDGRSLPELLADPAALGPAREALTLAAARTPDAAIKAWSEMEEGQSKILLQQPLLMALLQQDPEKAFVIAKDLPGASGNHVVREWLEADAPAAIKGVLSLPFESDLRQKLLDALRGGGSGADPAGDRDFFGTMTRRDLLIAAQDLPPELMREVTRGP